MKMKAYFYIVNDKLGKSEPFVLGTQLIHFYRRGQRYLRCLMFNGGSTLFQWTGEITDEGNKVWDEVK